jgi:streptogramin lyase
MNGSDAARDASNEPLGSDDASDAVPDKDTADGPLRNDAGDGPEDVAGDGPEDVAGSDDASADPSLSDAGTDSRGDGGEEDALHVFTAQFAEFPIPTENSQPSGITIGPDGNIWFTEAGANKIGRMTPSGVITEYGPLWGIAHPQQICVGPDGNLWFTESYEGNVGRISPQGDITEFFLGVPAPNGITAGPDGNIWFIEYLKVGRITPSGQELTEFGLPDQANASLITSGSDGNLWVTDTNGAIYRVTPSGVITSFDTPTPMSGASGIASDPGTGRIWFTEQDAKANRIGTIDPSTADLDPTGAITEFRIPTVASTAFGIAIGPGGGAWFTENFTDRIGHVSASGAMTEFVTPTRGNSPMFIVADSAGYLWFTASGSNKIFRLTPPR